MMSGRNFGGGKVISLPSLDIDNAVYCGFFPDGIEFCDRAEAQGGSYHKVAFWSYGASRLIVHDTGSPLLPEICRAVEQYRQKKVDYDGDGGSDSETILAAAKQKR